MTTPILLRKPWNMAASKSRNFGSDSPYVTDQRRDADRLTTLPANVPFLGDRPLLAAKFYSDPDDANNLSQAL